MVTVFWLTIALCVLLFFLFFFFFCQLLQQLKRLICDLCRLYNLPQHPDVEMLDQPLPTGPVNQEKKVHRPGKKNQTDWSWFVFGNCIPFFLFVLFMQHGTTDEVTSEEEEEEDMGEVQFFFFLFFSQNIICNRQLFYSLLIQPSIHPLSFA